MIDINEVKKFVGFIAKQNGRGRLSPEEYNMAANRVNIGLFTERIGLPNDYKPGYPVATISYGVSEKIENDLLPFKRQTDLAIDMDGRSDWPEGYVYHTAIGKLITLGTGETRWQEATILRDQIRNTQLGSVICAPTSRYPACELFPDYIQWHPKTLAAANMIYLSFPETVVWAYTTTN
jgi:hypothetical protein